MRRGRSSPSPSPFRVLAHQHAVHGGASTSNLIRSFNVETNPARPVRPSPLTASAIGDMPLDFVDRIRSFPLFRSASDDFLAAIGTHLHPQIHAAHDHIVTEGDEAKAMYWLVRGVVAVTSRDGEAIYAELKPGAFFGEIGVLMDMPRTATILARTKCLLVVLKKEDLHAELPKFPDMEKAIRQEAEERLAILKKKKHQSNAHLRPSASRNPPTTRASRESSSSTERPGDAASPAETGILAGTSVGASSWSSSGDGSGSNSNNDLNKIITTTTATTNCNAKKRKSPSPVTVEDSALGGSVLGSGHVNVRETLRELPLFSTLPPDTLHFLGLSAQPRTFVPFTDIVRQGSRGNDIYFIVRGEAEVIHDTGTNGHGTHNMPHAIPAARPRLKAGQYFGEVASLGLSPGRTATVRSISTVECLMIGGEALDELWRRCPPEVRIQVEDTARTRYPRLDDDVHMAEAGDENEDGGELSPASPKTFGGSGPSRRRVTFPPASDHISKGVAKDDIDTRQPSDPDPFLSVDMENLRNRRRASLATALPSPHDPATHLSMLGHGMGRISSTEGSPLKNFFALTPSHAPTSNVEVEEEDAVPSKRQRVLPQRPRHHTTESVTRRKVDLPGDILVHILAYLDVLELLRLRQVCRHWQRLLTESPRLCRVVDLSRSNRRVTDWVLIHIVAPFVGERAIEVNISNCFHITDIGFHALWTGCGKNVKRWKMRSVWEVSASQILEMADHAKGLEMVDWSNCRKVGDNLLARVVGWVVPEPPLVQMQRQTQQQYQRQKNAAAGQANAPSPSQTARQNNVQEQQPQQQPQKPQQQPSPQHQQHQQPQQQQPPPPQQQQQQGPIYRNGRYPPRLYVAPPPPGTVIGCPKLKHLDLSYCKHITDRSMHHLAVHASNRLESLYLTRCTSVTDAGFQMWASFRFNSLTRLCLADCTYLSDNSIIALVNAAKNLTHLDLSFCCALSDTATEVVALGLPRLRELRLAFCGSAVGDASLGCIALHSNELRCLSVRGCVRVTGFGVENVLEGCGRLEWLDVSQCKNLDSWLMGGGVHRWGYDERTTRTLATTPYANRKVNGNGHVAGPRVYDTPHGDSASSVGGSSVRDQLPGSSIRLPPILPDPNIAGASSTVGVSNGGVCGDSRMGMFSPTVNHNGASPTPAATTLVKVMPMTRTMNGIKVQSLGPVIRPVVPPQRMRSRWRKPVMFVVEKGGGYLR